MKVPAGAACRGKVSDEVVTDFATKKQYKTFCSIFAVFWNSINYKIG